VTVAPHEIKACCAAAYSSAAARFLLGDCFHPGGASLTSRLLQAMRVGPGDLVVDVACGPGASALQLARETGCHVVGVDLAAPRRPAADPRVRFVEGDAEALPLEDASVDGVLCECALCTFPDKPAAAREFARVLRPGARLALSDLTAQPGMLADSLRSLSAWVACVADARPLEEICALLEAPGLVIERADRFDEVLARFLERIEARLKVATLLGADGVAHGRRLIADARSALEQGVIGYGVVIATRP
jgi:arsenite methyltransferase